MRLQIVPNASSIQFRYLDFSMADGGFVSVFMVNWYNPLPRRCIIIFSFHAKKLYGVRMNSFGNSVFLLSSIFSTCKKNMVCLFPRNPLTLIPCKCVEPAQNRSSQKMTQTVCRENMRKEKQERKNGRIPINLMNE